MMLDSLSPVKVAQTTGAFGTGGIQTTHGPLWVLTNGLCENTGHWNTEGFRYDGVGHQEHGSEEVYPLTSQEVQFIQPDGIDLPGYAPELALGYSAWWQSRKWFSPLLEYCYVPEDPADQHHGLERGAADFFLRPDCLRALVESEAERLAVLLKPVHGEVLLDLEGFTDRFAIHLLVPCEEVLARFRSNGGEAWQRFLRSMFSIAEPPRLVYIDTNCEQERGGLPEASNAVGKTYGCALYDLTPSPPFPPDDFDSLDDWLRTQQEPLLKEWGPSEEAAVHHARLVCDEQNFVPIDPFTRRFLPRQTHMLQA